MSNEKEKKVITGSMVVNFIGILAVIAAVLYVIAYLTGFIDGDFEWFIVLGAIIAFPTCIFASKKMKK